MDRPRRGRTMATCRRMPSSLPLEGTLVLLLVCRPLLLHFLFLLVLAVHVLIHLLFVSRVARGEETPGGMLGDPAPAAPPDSGCAKPGEQGNLLTVRTLGPKAPRDGHLISQCGSTGVHSTGPHTVIMDTSGKKIKERDSRKKLDLKPQSPPTSTLALSRKHS